MGIRNHKSKIRIISIILISLFALSMLISGLFFIKNNFFSEDANRQVIAVVDGKKLYRDQFTREFTMLKDNLDNMTLQKRQQLAQMGVEAGDMQSLPDDILKEYVFQMLIDKEILLSSAKGLKIKTDESKINKQVEENQKQAGGKSNFIKALANNGYNLTTYKELLREQQIMKEVQEKITSTSKITDEEVKKTYERFKYSGFFGRDFEDVKEDIKNSLNGERTQEIINSYLEKAKKSTKIEIKSPEFKKIYEDMTKVIAEKDGYKYTKSALNDQIINIYATTPQGYSKELVDGAIKNLKENLDRLIKIMAKAKAAGIKPTEGLVGVEELSSYSKKYFSHLIDTYQPSEETMLEKFNSNKDAYNIKNTIAGYVIGEEYQPLEKDFEVAKKKAEEIAKTVTVENFSEKAKQFSQDTGSAAEGGSLGNEVDLTGLVPEFAEAVKNTERGKITAPVRSQYGYHIIYVEDKNAQNVNLAKVRHILVIPSISEETKQATIKKVTDLKKELIEKKVTWENVEKQDRYNFSIKEQFKALQKSDAIPGIGKNDTALSEKLFTSKSGDILEQQEDFGYFLLTKISEIPFKEATFADVKERIRLEFALEYANSQIENIN